MSEGTDVWIVSTSSVVWANDGAPCAKSSKAGAKRVASIVKVAKRCGALCFQIPKGLESVYVEAAGGPKEDESHRRLACLMVSSYVGPAARDWWLGR
jgi:hypothetical protein